MSEIVWTADVYRELRRLADVVMAGERGAHTLQPTALAHEVWLRLVNSRNADALDRAAFLRLAAQAMRRILIDHARRAHAAKRGGRARRTTLEGKAVHDPSDFALDLDAALTALDRLDPALASLVELRYFGGLSTEELAAALGVSARTVKRRWRFARAWLQQRMQEPAQNTAQKIEQKIAQNTAQNTAQNIAQEPA